MTFCFARKLYASPYSCNCRDHLSYLHEASPTQAVEGAATQCAPGMDQYLKVHMPPKDIDYPRVAVVHPIMIEPPTVEYGSHRRT